MSYQEQGRGNHKPQSSRNKTIAISKSEMRLFKDRLIRAEDVTAKNCIGRTINGSYLDVVDKLPQNSVDLLILDPPYNLNKTFGSYQFAKLPTKDYTHWLAGIIHRCLNVLKSSATVYVCGDWLTSISIFEAASLHLHVRNRITWEREKGRGALSNWKNASEDIWFCTVSNNYTFNVDNVKIRRQVNAPYTDKSGTPKDWKKTSKGNFRDTFPSNLWTDITIPFWSMPENTEHPTQKSEKLIAKLVLASSNENDLVLDPFLGSGTTSVVAKKLGRNFIGIEQDEDYAIVAEKRLLLAEESQRIQGYEDLVFWERNTLKNFHRTANG